MQHLLSAEKIDPEIIRQARAGHSHTSQNLTPHHLEQIGRIFKTPDFWPVQRLVAEIILSRHLNVEATGRLVKELAGVNNLDDARDRLAVIDWTKIIKVPVPRGSHPTPPSAPSTRRRDNASPLIRNNGRPLTQPPTPRPDESTSSDMVPPESPERPAEIPVREHGMPASWLLSAVEVGRLSIERTILSGQFLAPRNGETDHPPFVRITGLYAADPDMHPLLEKVIPKINDRAFMNRLNDSMRNSLIQQLIRQSDIDDGDEAKQLLDDAAHRVRSDIENGAAGYVNLAQARLGVIDSLVMNAIMDELELRSKGQPRGSGISAEASSIAEVPYEAVCAAHPAMSRAARKALVLGGFFQLRPRTIAQVMVQTPGEVLGLLRSVEQSLGNTG